MSLRQRTAIDKMLPEKNEISFSFLMSLEVLSAILIFRLAQLFIKFSPNPNKEVTSRRKAQGGALLPSGPEPSLADFAKPHKANIYGTSTPRKGVLKIKMPLGRLCDSSAVSSHDKGQNAKNADVIYERSFSSERGREPIFQFGTKV